MRDELLKIWPERVVTLLDLGCRDCWYTSGLPGVNLHIGVDCWQPALDRGIAKSAAGNIPGFRPLLYDAVNFIETCGPESFDAVLAIDLLEHLDPAEARQMMVRMSDVARIIAVVWTTLGMIEQGPYDVDGEHNPFERHQWGPTEDTFKKLGWSYKVYPAWHEARGGAILGWLLKG